MKKYWISAICILLVVAVAMGAVFSNLNSLRATVQALSEQMDSMYADLDDLQQELKNTNASMETVKRSAAAAADAAGAVEKRVQALEETAAAPTADDKEPVHLVWILYAENEKIEDWPEVEAALNAYSAEKIGVTCEFRYLENQDLRAAIMDGTQYDIIFTSDWWNDFASNVAAGNFRDLTEDLERYPALKNSVIDLAWSGVKLHDSIYAIPHMKDIGYEVFWILNSDYYLNQKDFDKDLHISFKGIEPYLRAYKDDYPDDYPLKLGNLGLTSWQNALVDWLSMDVLVGLEWEAQGTDQEDVVKSALEIPAWQERLRTLHRWYEKGYINPDADQSEPFPRAEAGVIQSGQGWFGAETVWANVIKKPIYISRYDGPYMSTSSIRGSMTAVSSFTEHPDEALKLIELMNTDPWYRETARYGIEGKHFIRNVDGTVIRTDLGSTNMGVQAYVQGHYTVGALEASLFPEVPTDVHQWERTMAGYADAKLSAVMGFTPDLGPVEEECQALKQIIASYRPALYTGVADPDELIPVMLNDMEEAGLRTVVDELQRQLDAFLENN